VNAATRAQKVVKAVVKKARQANVGQTLVTHFVLLRVMNMNIQGKSSIVASPTIMAAAIRNSKYARKLLCIENHLIMQM
jgi:hypothetical protein